MPTRGQSPWFLSLDQGGHSTRAMVFDSSGVLIEEARAAVATAAPSPGWVEQDAGEIAASLRSVIDAIAHKLGRHTSRLDAAGLATQRSSLVCWDRLTGLPLTPVLSWQDRRNQHWLDGLSDHAGAIRARTGLPLSPHYGASKLRWCLDHVDAVAHARDQGRLAGGPLASYLLCQLLPERPCVVDPANAARTLLWNLETCEWDTELLQLFGIASDWLPACVPTRYAFGNLAVGKRMLPLRIVTGDQAAALYSQADPEQAHVYVNLGTGAFLQRPLAELPTDVDGLLRSLVYCDTDRRDYVVEGTVNGAGTALDWARDELGLTDIERALPRWLERSGEIPIFLNGIAGLGSPWWLGHFPSRFIGSAQPWAQAVAIAESIVFMLCENLVPMRRLQAGVEAIEISGGLAALNGLCQHLADLSGLPVLRSRQREATARGIAYLLARNHDTDWRSEAPDRFEPAASPELQQRYRRWQSAMQQAVADQRG